MDGYALVAWHQFTTAEVTCLASEYLADTKLLNPVKTRHVMPGATATNVQVIDTKLRDILTLKLHDLFSDRPVLPRVPAFMKNFKRARRSSDRSCGTMASKPLFFIDLCILRPDAEYQACRCNSFSLSTC